MAANKKRKSAKKVFLSVLCVFLGLVLVALLGATMTVESYLNKINRVDGTQPTMSDAEIESILAETEAIEDDYTGEVLQAEEVTMPTAPAEIIEQEDHVVNILLIGQDRRGGTARHRSDSMILCTIDSQKKTIVLTSFLRDMYLQMPDYNGKSYSATKLNHTYVYGGMEMLNDCLELNFGVKVDHNIEVDFSGFEDIIDAIGGVDIELTYNEAVIVRGGKGMNHLNGAQALEYARIRKLDSDFGRTNRQRNVLNAVFDKIKTLSLTELLELTDTIFPLITTDMSNADIINYVVKFAPMLKELEITNQAIPADGTYRFATVAGMSVIIVDLEANIEHLKNTIGIS